MFRTKPTLLSRAAYSNICVTNKLGASSLLRARFELLNITFVVIGKCGFCDYLLTFWQIIHIDA